MAVARGAVRYSTAVIAVEAGWFVAEYGRQMGDRRSVADSRGAELIADRGRSAVPPCS